MSDLDAMRQAALLSIGSRTGAPGAVTPMSLETKELLKDALVDLRSVGLSLDEIVDRAKVRHEYVEELYREMKWPVPVRVPDVHIQDGQEKPEVIEQIKPEVQGYREPEKKWSFYSNRVYRKEERPEWLKDLVIDLASTDEESEEEDGHVISPVKNLAVSSRKRRLSKVHEMNLEEVHAAKGAISTLIDSTSQLISNAEKNEKLRAALQRSIVKHDKELKDLQSSILRLQEKIANAKEKQSQLEITSVEDLKAELSAALIRLDSLEQREVQIQEEENRRIHLKQKLLDQMKKKRSAPTTASPELSPTALMKAASTTETKPKVISPHLF